MVYISLGSNIGNRLKNLQSAIKLLKKGGFNIIKISSVYETSAWGITDQPKFLNLVLKGKTKLPPAELLGEIKRIEKEIGRKPAKKWGVRIIDIDILFYNKIIIDTPKLKIPHPRLHKRNFVLIPLKELAPRLLHSVLKKTVSQMLKDTDDKGSVVRYNGKESVVNNG